MLSRFMPWAKKWIVGPITETRDLRNAGKVHTEFEITGGHQSIHVWYAAAYKGGNLRRDLGSISGSQLRIDVVGGFFFLAGAAGRNGR